MPFDETTPFMKFKVQKYTSDGIDEATSLMKIKTFKRRVAGLSIIKNAILYYLICNPLVDHLLN